MFEFDLALELTNPKFIAWVCKDVMVLTFFCLFTCTYCRGKGETERKDQNTFQRLRLAVIIMSLCDFFWPFQFYFTLDFRFKICILSLASMFDLLLCYSISTLSLRVFSAYYRAKRYQNHLGIPWYDYFIVFMYILSMIVTVILEILAFSMDSSKFIRDFYMINAVIWFSITAVFSITLIVFLFRLITLFKKINGISIYISPSLRPTSPDTSYRQQLMNCTTDKANKLYVKLIWLCAGIVVYYANLLAVWSYFFVTWDFSVTNTIGWIIQHEIIGHFIFFVTLWWYLRVINGNNNIEGSGNDEGSTKQFERFGYFCNSNTALTGNTPKIFVNTPQVAPQNSVDVTESSQEFSTTRTYGNSNYRDQSVSVTIDTV